MKSCLYLHGFRAALREVRQVLCYVCPAAVLLGPLGASCCVEAAVGKRLHGKCCSRRMEGSCAAEPLSSGCQ